MGTVMLSSPVEVAAEVGEIEFLPLRITFEAKDDGRLPPFLGSALRGALGWSLRRVSCALRRESCPSCIVRERCAYGYIIETARPDGSERLPGHRDVPHPYMLEPPVPGAGEWRAGDNLSFWPLGHFFRNMGAYFIRRTFKGDELYTAIFRAYIKPCLYFRILAFGGEKDNGNVL